MNLNISFKNFKKTHISGNHQIIFSSKKCHDYNRVENLFRFLLIEKNSFIFESVEKGKIRGRYTIIGLNPDKIYNIKDNLITINSNGIKKIGEITFISPSAETSTRTFEIEIEADNNDLSFKSGITASISIEGSELLAHKIPPSILTLQDDGTIGVKGLNSNNKVVFYPIQTVKDTVDGMWVSGLPEESNLIISGQEYVTIDQLIEVK